MRSIKTLAVLTAVLFPSLGLTEHWRYCATNAPLTTPCKQWLLTSQLGEAKEQATDVPAFNQAWMLSHGAPPRPSDEVPRFGQAPESATRPFTVQTAELLIR